MQLHPAPITDDFLESYKDKTPPWGFGILGQVVYKRTYARPVGDRTEEWPETIQRVINGAQTIGAKFTKSEAERLFDLMFNLKGSVGGRMLWQLGTANNSRLGMDSLVNCWFTNIRSPEDFSWIFDRLMLGGGVGFSIDTPEALGLVRQGRVVHEDVSDAGFIVPDSRQGWSELLLRTVRAYLGDERDPQEFSYSTQLVRPAGTPIKTFGGVASGPGILVEGIGRIAQILDGAVGRTLTSVEILDIANLIGEIVVSGNVRRSAEIALGSPYDSDYLMAKRWDLGTIPNWRAMSNNSVYMPPDGFQRLLEDHEAFWANADPEENPERKSAWELLWNGYAGNGEPYGFFNLETSQRFGRIGEELPDMTISGTNPCAEIGLAHRESCNLSEIFLPNVESQEELTELALLLYKVQKAVAAMPALDKTSTMITEKNMRLGLGVTGYLQATEEQKGWLDVTYRALREFDRQWSELNGWPTSVRLTTVKPSGTLSLLAGVTPGVHPAYSQNHVRRVRMSANDPVADWCKTIGVPHENVRRFDGTEDPNTLVFEFPCSYPESTKTADEMSAIDQIETQRRLQREWADNAVSITVTFKDEELPEIREYLVNNWHEMKSVSFLRYSDHGFDQAPLEPISEQEYLERLRAIDVNGFVIGGGMSELLDGEECATGACPVR